MHTLDVLVQVGGAENFATVRTLEVFVLVHWPDVLSQNADGKVFLTMVAGLPDPLMGLPHVSVEVVHTDTCLTNRAVCFLF